MNTPIHILNQFGVLASFSVAKKITEKEINKYFLKHKKSGKSNSQIREMLKKKIVSDIQKAIFKNEIPGLISQDGESVNQSDIDPSLLKNVPELNRMIVVVSQKLTDKHYDKMSLCYFINSLVNVLGLTEDDFTKFHKQNNIDDKDNEDDDGEEFDELE